MVWDRVDILKNERVLSMRKWTKWKSNAAKSMRGYIFKVLSVGPIPKHVAFIMDGNRRYAKKKKLKEGEGHRAGSSSLASILMYCYEMGIKYVTVYAFSIDNFRREPDEVKDLMDLMLEKIDGLLQEESLVNQFGVRVYFIGNLGLLNARVRAAANAVMKATSNNTRFSLILCVAYTSRDEMVHAVRESCVAKYEEIQRGDHLGRMDPCVIRVQDIEKNLRMAIAPDPDILIRSSGETRLSNFLLWQTSNCLLYSPLALWPEIGLWHLVWAVLLFQHHNLYFEKKKKQE